MIFIAKYTKMIALSSRYTEAKVLSPRNTTIKAFQGNTRLLMATLLETTQYSTLSEKTTAFAISPKNTFK